MHTDAVFPSHALRLGEPRAGATGLRRREEAEIGNWLVDQCAIKGGLRGLRYWNHGPVVFSASVRTHRVSMLFSIEPPSAYAVPKIKHVICWDFDEGVR